MRRHQRLAPAPYDALTAFDRPSPPERTPRQGEIKLGHAVEVNPPSWIEAVVLVQRVCARLGRSQMPPMIGDLTITFDGDVRFAPGGVADHREIIDGLCRLLERLIGSQSYPMNVWLVLERARATPRAFAGPDDLGAAFNRVLPPGGPARLAAYAAEAAAMRRVASIPVGARVGPAPWFMRRARRG